jgi:adenylate kinase family enzyme
MNIFVIGMPGSGRTTVARALCQAKGYNYIQATSWVKSTFRDPNPGEHPQQYLDEYHTWYTSRMKINPRMITDSIYDSMDTYQLVDNNCFVIDGLSSPKDFAELFDYNKDMVVFLNRTNNESEFKDYENIGVSVMRDYCFWLSSANLLSKEKWFEYNYQIPGEDSDFIKSLGSKNSVFIVKSINKVISHLNNYVESL